MTSRQQDWLDVLATLPVAGHDSRQAGDARPWSARMRARLWAGRYDREIEDGVSPAPASPLAVHRARLVSPRERDDLAHALRLAMHDAAVASHFNARVPIRSIAVHDCADVIAAVCDRLTDPFPVRPRGMARLRLLLSDGRGPLYRSGKGTLTAAMRGVLAAL
jgi:hypothetical protein